MKKFAILFALLSLTLLAGCGASGNADSSVPTAANDSTAYVPTPLIGDDVNPAIDVPSNSTANSSGALDVSKGDTDTATVGGTTAPPTVTVTPDYDNLDGLWFVSSAQQPAFKAALERYLQSKELSPARVTVIGDPGEAADGTYRFHLLLSNGMILKGQCDKAAEQYTYSEQTDPNVLAKFRAITDADGYYDEAAAQQPVA